MKKLILILAVLWFGLNAFAKSVQADDYNKAVVAHVIKENISGNGVDMSVLEAEMAKLLKLFTKLCRLDTMARNKQTENLKKYIY